jgi:hypothetical protein
MFTKIPIALLNAGKCHTRELESVLLSLSRENVTLL